MTEYLKKQDVLDILDNSYLLPYRKEERLRGLKSFSEQDVSIIVVHDAIKRYMDFLDLGIQQTWEYIEESCKRAEEKNANE